MYLHYSVRYTPYALRYLCRYAIRYTLYAALPICRRLGWFLLALTFATYCAWAPALAIKGTALVSPKGGLATITELRKEPTEGGFVGYIIPSCVTAGSRALCRPPKREEPTPSPEQAVWSVSADRKRCPLFFGSAMR